jgi:hypothetical protein
MAINLKCDCGRNIRVKDEFAGKLIRCPDCKKSLRVPDKLAAETLAPRPTPKPKRDASGLLTAHTRVWHETFPRYSYWIHTNGLDNVVALTAEELYVGWFLDDECERMRPEFAAGEIPAAVPKKATIIPLEQIKKVESNLHHESITIDYLEPGRTEESSKNILCNGKEMRDQLMDALHERLANWKRAQIVHSRWRAAVAPSIILAFLAFIGFCFFMVATGHDEGANDGKPVRTNWIGMIILAIYDFFGPIPIVVLAMLLLIPTVIWLVLRVRTPPIMDTISPATTVGRKKGR